MEWVRESLFQEEIQPEEAPMDRLEPLLQQQVKRLIEALLFASSEPLSIVKLREIIDTFYLVKPRHIRESLNHLQEEYVRDQRGFRLEEVSDGFLIQSCEEFIPYIRQLFRNKRVEKLSPAATEVLAIIAYRQPMTRPQIEALRGVDSSGIIQTLLERQLIAAIGRLEAPGRPTLYGTTEEFLKHYDLKSLSDLPNL